MRRILIPLIALVLALGTLTGVAAANGPRSSAEPTIASFLAHSQNFTTLAALVERAGLTGALSGQMQLTVFAPTNEAFERLAARDPALFAAVLANPALLQAVLLYHVTPGAVPASTIVGLSSVATLLGPRIAVSLKRGYVRLNGDSKVYRTDIMASNGIIHGLVEVLIPPL